MDLRTYLTAIRRGWWLALTFVVIFGGIATGLAYRATPIYAATLRFYISTPFSANSTALSTDQFAQDRANSYATLLSSDQLATMILANEKSLRMTPREVAGEISGSAQLNTVLVSATVHDPSPRRALRIASAIAAQFPKMVDQLDNSSSRSTSVSLTVVSGPVVGSSPVSPRKKLIISLALLLGLFVGLIAAVLRHVLDTSIQTTGDVEGITDAPVLTTIAYDASAKAAPLLVADAAHSPRAEAFRRLRTNLQFIHAARHLHTVVITSAVEGEGKSTTATNLALVMAEADQKVLLIEADLRRPRVADYLGLEGSAGLTSVLLGHVSIDDVLQTWGDNNLNVLVSGALPPNPSELLGSPRMVQLLTSMRSRFDLVLIDTPPLLPVTDAAVLATEADGVVLVLHHAKTKRAQLSTAVRALEAVEARLLGTVVNMKSIHGAEKQTYGQVGQYTVSGSANDTGEEGEADEDIDTSSADAAERDGGQLVARLARNDGSGPQTAAKDAGAEAPSQAQDPVDDRSADDGPQASGDSAARHDGKAAGRQTEARSAARRSRSRGGPAGL